MPVHALGTTLWISSQLRVLQAADLRKRYPPAVHKKKIRGSCVARVTHRVVRCWLAWRGKMQLI